MLIRLSVAIVGGLLITVAMLIAMSGFAEMFRERSGERFFLIDVLEAPRRGRPDRPGAAVVSPNREVDRLDAGPVDLDFDTVDDPAATPQAEPAAPSLGTSDDSTVDE